MASEPPRSVLDLIGDTPLVEATRLDCGLCRLFLKLESQNPGGSIKDRIGLSMIRAATADGRLKPGGTIVEATAGNTGLGLALVAAQTGHRLVLVIPDKMSEEKVRHLRALGAEVRMTRSDVGKGHPDYYQDMARRLAAEMPGAWLADQFGNPANPAAHETGTGPEIHRQMGGRVDAIVCGVGSGGTLTGLSRYFARVSPNTKMVLADPAGSILADYVRTGRVGAVAGSWLVEGIGEDFVPPVADFSRVAEAVRPAVPFDLMGVLRSDEDAERDELGDVVGEAASFQHAAAEHLEEVIHRVHVAERANRQRAAMRGLARTGWLDDQRLALQVPLHLREGVPEVAAVLLEELGVARRRHRPRSSTTSSAAKVSSSSRT